MYIHTRLAGAVMVPRCYHPLPGSNLPASCCTPSRTRQLGFTEERPQLGGERDRATSSAVARSLSTPRGPLCLSCSSLVATVFLRCCSRCTVTTSEAARGMRAPIQGGRHGLDYRTLASINMESHLVPIRVAWTGGVLSLTQIHRHRQ